MTSAAPKPPTAGFVRPEELLALAALLKRSGREIESELRGASMGHTIPSGARIRIRCGDAGACAAGDVVAFVTGRVVVAHRVVGRGRRGRARSYVVTRGDGALLCDPPVPVESLFGVVTEWRDADRWRPAHFPSRPAPSLLRRLVSAGELAFVAAVLEVHVGLARRVAAGALALRPLAARARRVLGRLRSLRGSP